MIAKMPKICGGSLEACIRRNGFGFQLEELWADQFSLQELGEMEGIGPLFVKSIN